MSGLLPHNPGEGLTSTGTTRGGEKQKIEDEQFSGLQGEHGEEDDGPASNQRERPGEGSRGESGDVVEVEARGESSAGREHEGTRAGRAETEEVSAGLDARGDDAGAPGHERDG